MSDPLEFVARSLSEPEDAVTGRMVARSELSSRNTPRAEARCSLSLSLSLSSLSLGVGVFLTVPSCENLQLVGEKRESFNSVSAVDAVVDVDPRFDRRLDCVRFNGFGINLLDLSWLAGLSAGCSPDGAVLSSWIV